MFQMSSCPIEPYFIMIGSLVGGSVNPYTLNSLRLASRGIEESWLKFSGLTKHFEVSIMLWWILWKHFRCFNNSCAFLLCWLRTCEVVRCSLQKGWISVHIVSMCFNISCPITAGVPCFPWVVREPSRKPLASSLLMLVMSFPSAYSMKFRFRYRAPLQCRSGL